MAINAVAALAIPVIRLINPLMPPACFGFCNLTARRFHTVEIGTPTRMINVEGQRENLLGNLGGFAEHFLPIPCHIHRQALSWNTGRW